MKTSRITALDSVRGIASLSVVVHHCFLAFPMFLNTNYHKPTTNAFVNLMAYTPFHFLWAGHEAVILFFILSGFVLSLPYLNHNKPTYLQYLIKRIFRIYVPYLVVILTSSVLLTLNLHRHGISSLSDWFNTQWVDPITIKTILQMIFMVENYTQNVNTATWSLIVEMRISLLFPIIIFFVAKVNWKQSIIVGMMITFFIAVINNYIKSDILNTIYYVPMFIYGATLAKYRERVSSIIITIRPHIKMLIVLIGINLYIIKWLTPFKILHRQSIADCFIVLGSLIFISFAMSWPIFRELLEFRILQWLGNISFSLYLVHPVVLLTMVYYLNNILPIWIIIGLVPIASLGISSVLRSFVEQNSINFGKKLLIRFDKKQLQQNDRLVS